MLKSMASLGRIYRVSDTAHARKRVGTDWLVSLALGFGCALSCFAQANSGTVHGLVVDPSGAVISGAAVTIENPVSHYNRSTATDSQGKFEFDNLPYNNYHLSAAATATGFQVASEDI